MQQQAPQIEMPSLWVALIPIVLTIGLLGLQIFYYDDFTPHIALAVGFAITGLVGWSQGWRWSVSVRPLVFRCTGRQARWCPGPFSATRFRRCPIPPTWRRP